MVSAREWILATCLAGTGGPALAQKGTGEERVIAFTVVPVGIDFQVASGGCTHKVHFGLETVRVKPLTVRLVRLTPDYCEAYLPKGVTIRFSFAELGLGARLSPTEQATLTVLNPVRAP